jgi:hypothetical protein
MVLAPASGVVEVRMDSSAVRKHLIPNSYMFIISSIVHILRIRTDILIDE